MRIDIKDLVEGKLDGEYVWVCDFRHNNIFEKPIRHVAPERVLVRSNTEIPTKTSAHGKVYQVRTIYYSESHFVRLSKKTGKPIKSMYAPFDNTGYRSYTGVPLNIFDNEAECQACYRELKLKVLEQLEGAYQEQKARYEAMKAELLA
jgi:hypothetical protein